MMITLYILFSGIISQQKKNSLSVTAARRIILEAFNRLGIHDGEDVLEKVSITLPTMNHIIGADMETLQSIPVGISVLEAIEQFFGCDSTIMVVSEDDQE